MKELISVVLPAYNCEETLGRAIDSIIDQSVEDWEMLIVYDESEDNTIGVINNYCEKDNRIKLIQSRKKQGIAAALNLGIKSSQGKFIARMDADDISYPNRFEKQLQTFRLNPDISICGTGFSIKTIHGSKNQLVLEKHDDIKAAMIYTCPLAHPTVMMKKEIFEDEENYYDKSAFVEDYELWFRLVTRYKMMNVNEILLDYSFEGENNSLRFKEKVYKKTIEFRRRYLNKYLKADIFRFNDEIVGLSCKLSNILENRLFLVDLYDYLFEIFEKNRIEGFYAEESLNKAIIAMWNYGVNNAYLWDVSFSDTLIDLHVDISSNWIKYLKGILNAKRNDEIREKLKTVLENIKIPLSKKDSVIVYGIGGVCEEYMTEYNSELNVVAFVDGNVKKQGQDYKGLKVKSPNEIIEHTYDYILIASKDYYREIRDLLMNEFSISKDKLLPIDCLIFSDL